MAPILTKNQLDLIPSITNNVQHKKKRINKNKKNLNNFLKISKKISAMVTNL